MRRKGDAELQILALLFFITAVGQWAFMVGAPQQYDEMISRQTDDAESMVKTGTIRSYMEAEYIPTSLGDAAYQGMYEQGVDGVGPWGPDNVPEWEETKPVFDTAVSDELRTNYIGAMDSGAGCGLNGQDQVSMTITEEVTDEPLMVFDVANDGPLHVECEAAAPATDYGAGRSSLTTELIAVPDSREVNRMRYESLHELAYEFARDDDFQSTIADTLTYASNYVEEIGSEQDVGVCNNAGGSCYTQGMASFPSFSSVKTAAEDAQGTAATDDLQAPLDEMADDFAASVEDEYGEVDVEAEVVEIDYTIEDQHQVTDDDTEQDGFRVTSCDQSCHNVDTDSASCSSCGCSVSCSCNADPCPATVCSTSGSWNTYERGGDLWTQDPWTTSSSGGTSTVSLYDWEENHYTGPVAAPSSTEGNNVEIFRIQDSGEDCSGDSCSCRDVESAQNDVSQTPRRVWEIDQLTSEVTIEIRITDLENEIPVASGFEHPVYTVEYVQEQNWGFSGDPSIVSAD